MTLFSLFHSLIARFGRLFSFSFSFNSFKFTKSTLLCLILLGWIGSVRGAIKSAKPSSGKYNTLSNRTAGTMTAIESEGRFFAHKVNINALPIIYLTRLINALMTLYNNIKYFYIDFSCLKPFKTLLNGKQLL